jgi:hypothetical protein
MKWLAPAFALSLAAAALFAGHVPISLAQQGQPDPRNEGKAPGACYICGTLDYVLVPGADWFGTLAEDACKKYLGSDSASPGARRSYCNQAAGIGKSCPKEAAVCNSPNGKYCGGTLPGKGFIYSSGKGGIDPDPLSSSPIANALIGDRLMYTQTKTIDGQTWYYVSVPGTPAMGWIRGSDVSCIRPTVPPPPRPTNDDKAGPPMEKLAPGVSAAQTAGSRG